MKYLSLIETNSISGGNLIYAAGVGVSTYVGASKLVSATQTLNELGSLMGETVYTKIHPNELGKMVFSEKDFRKEWYIMGESQNAPAILIEKNQ